MATTIGKLNFLVAADSSGVVTGLKTGETAISRLRSLAGGMTGALAGLFGGVTVTGAAGWGVKLASDAEQASIAFEVLLGSGEKATQMLGELRNLANKSPLELTDVREGARLLLNFGVAHEAILPSLRMLGDVSGGNAEKMNRLALAFGQSAAAGRLMGQDLLQMINAGFNPLQEISKRTGESMADLKKRMEAGAISSQEVVQAFQDATSEGGRFFGMMDRQSETLSGRFSTLKDNVALLFTEMGERLLPALKSLTEAGISVVDWLNNLNPATVQSTVSIIAMATAFGTTIALVPRIIAAGAAIVKTLRAIATGGAIAQALSGPQGLISLAAGLAAAAGAGIAVNAMFDNVGMAAEGAATKAKSAAKAVDEMKPVQWGKEEIKTLKVNVDDAGVGGKLASAKKGVGDIGSAADSTSKRLRGTRNDISALFNAGESSTADDGVEAIKLHLSVVNDELKQARDNFTALQATAAAGLGTAGLDEARRKFEELSAAAAGLHSQLGESVTTTLKNQLDSIEAMQDSTKSAFDKLRKAVEDRRGNFVEAAERFTSAGQTAVARAGQEGLIQKEIQKLREAELEALRRLEVREIEIKEAIEDIVPVRVTERRI